MSVTKSVSECYEVRHNREWASITLRCWDRPANVGTPHECTYFCGEIAIVSSFGVWGHAWTACAVPFKEFLVGASFDYLFTKFMGLDLHRHDGDGTLRHFMRDIAERRRQGSLDRDEAREVWNAVVEERHEIAAGQTSCGYALMRIADEIGARHPMHDHFADPCAWPNITKPDSQAAWFWRELWPSFVEALKAEIQPAEHPIAVA